MQTSYFAMVSKMENPKLAVSISQWSPKWLPTVRRYPLLAPLPGTLLKWKHAVANPDDPILSTFTWKKYVEEYRETVLSTLDPRQVYEELGEDAILCCFERSSEPCHRHLVAHWLGEAVGVDIKEMVF